MTADAGSTSTEVLAALIASPDLRGLPSRHLVAMAGYGREVALGAGTAILRIGGPADRFWVVIAGTIDVELHAPVVGAIPLSRLGPGGVLGVSWVAAPHVVELDATAVTAVQAIEVDAVALRARCDRDPELGRDLYQQFAGLLRNRLHATRIQLLDLYGTPR